MAARIRRMEGGRRRKRKKGSTLAPPGLGTPCLIPLTLLLLGPLSASAAVHHDLTVRLLPDQNRIEVTDVITLPDAVFDVELRLDRNLAASLTPASGEVEIAETQTPGLAVLTRKIPGRTFAFSYQGVINHALRAVGEEYARGQRDTRGQIGPDGVYLDAGSGWYPFVGQFYRDEKLTFDLTVDLPAGWDAVSQGTRTDHGEKGDGRNRVRWVCDQPQDAIWLVANRFFSYVRDAGDVEAMVYLRRDDPALAEDYLDATAQYIAMYEKLIGDYAYGKFAAVENFWETGFGMPSFTLLGPRVIRFPFILRSSYPHEILHNWWGNSVYIDYGSGNWGEGLTAYLSDHLMKELVGEGPGHRQETLQKYADYVLEGRDLPLTAFRSRHGSVSEAVGYGKTLMLFHMLRNRLGDAAFIRGLQVFYRDNRYRTAGFTDVRKAFESASGERLEGFFSQWVTRTGAPELRLDRAEVHSDGSAYVLSITLQQVQPGDPYELRVPVAVTLDGEEDVRLLTMAMTGAEAATTAAFPSRPLRVDVDPRFDLFRRLDRSETPPALTQAFGSRRAVIVLPSMAPAGKREAYRRLAGTLSRAGPGEVDISWDAELDDIPEGASVWVFGRENLMAGRMLQSLAPYRVAVTGEGVEVDGSRTPLADHAFVMVSRREEEPDLADIYLTVENPDAFAGLGRKLPHYHKYSYLGFEGAEPENVLKGRWPVVDSPLSRDLVAGGTTRMGRLSPPKPLAELPPAFSTDRMMEDLSFLASEHFEGRGFGSMGLNRAAAFIADTFREIGLAPGGDDGFFRQWTAAGGETGAETRLQNVVAMLAGHDGDWRGQSVVVGAHYDHLGYGWPGALSVNRGRLHPGADDNASGVAVMLELARILAAAGPQPRTIVFAAFSSEEDGRRGSKRYTADPGPYPVEEIMGMVNLDTVGRMEDNRLLVMGGSSAAEWVHIFRGAGYATGVDVQLVSEELDTSDQVSFHEAGVPAVHLFTGAHLDYHKPTDTPDKINRDGLVKVAAVAREVVEYLAGREEPLTGSTGVAGSGSEVKEQRKVSFGVVPDFAFSGEGVRLKGAVPGSPAAVAGLREGDVITSMNGRRIGGLHDLSDVLRDAGAGDRVQVRYVRGGKALTTEAKLVER